MCTTTLRCHRLPRQPLYFHTPICHSSLTLHASLLRTPLYLPLSQSLLNFPAPPSNSSSLFSSVFTCSQFQIISILNSPPTAFPGVVSNYHPSNVLPRQKGPPTCLLPKQHQTEITTPKPKYNLNTTPIRKFSMFTKLKS